VIFTVVDLISIHFMKHFFQIISILVSSLFYNNLNAQTALDYSILYDRSYSTSFGSGLSSYNLNNQNNNGAFVNVTTYPVLQPTINTGAPLEHLDEMLKIAKAYQTTGPNYHSTAYLSAYVKAWNWWKNYNPKDTNWWWRSIGWPKKLYLSFVLMGRELKSNYPTDYSNMLAYLKNEWTPANITTYSNSPTGANTTDVCTYIMATAIVDEDEFTIKQVAGIITNALDIVSGEKSEGIQPDYSFTQHTGIGRQLYMGNYGLGYSNEIIAFLTLTAGTYFQLKDNKVSIIENLFLNGVSWSCFRNIFDQNQNGRFPEANRHGSISYQLSKIINANTKQKPALQQLYNWMTRSNENNALNVQTGNQMFWRHDFMVQKGKDYMVSTRMTSTRTVGCESGNNSGLNNYYTGSGVNYLYVTGNERYETLTDQNWRRLPGITAPQKPVSATLPLVEWGKNSDNLDAFAGGVSDGKTGACGFIYSKNQIETNMKAYKSYFYFHDYYVALGAGISAFTNYLVPYATTVNQVKHKGSFVVDNEGIATTMSASQTLKPVKSDWAYCNNVGYHFVINNELNYETATLGTTPIAWIGLNHGNLPTNKQYAYAVYPNITQAALQTKVSDPPFIVFSNTTSCQAVLDKNTNTAQIIFYNAGEISLPNRLGNCKVDSPAAVQLRWTNDSVFISAANPYCETMPLESLAVSISGAFINSGRDTVVNISMPQNEYQGKSVTLGLRKIITGQFVENFETPPFTSDGNLEGTNGWTLITTATDQGGVSPTIRSGPLYYPGYLSSGLGNVVKLSSTNDTRTSQKYIGLTAPDDGTAVYVAFLVKVSDAGRPNFEREIVGFNIGTAEWGRGRVYVRYSSFNEGVKFGVAKRDTKIMGNYIKPAEGTVDTHLLVMKYSRIAGDNNDVVTLYINPDLNKTEDAQINKLTAESENGASDLGTGDLYLNLRQRSLGAQLGGLRFGTTWETIVMGQTTAVKENISNFHNIYSFDKNIISGVAGKLKVYSLIGTELISTMTEGQFKTELGKGLYLVRFTDMNGKTTVAKVQL